MSVQNKDGKRVSITGITGFVGAYLAKKLLERRRPADIVILLSNSRKAMCELGFKPTKQLKGIIRDQVNYYLNPNNRKPWL
jgi:GDP-D-mannose dehydratase